MLVAFLPGIGRFLHGCCPYCEIGDLERFILEIFLIKFYFNHIISYSKI